MWIISSSLRLYYTVINIKYPLNLFWPPTKMNHAVLAGFFGLKGNIKR